MSTKSCLKCGHVATYDSTPPQACPECGAIYAKVEEALRQRQAARSQSAAGAASDFQDTAAGRPATRPTRPRFAADDPDVHAFAQRMRDESLYPAWRKIVGFFTIIGYAVAVILLVAAFFAAKGSIGTMIVGVGSAALVALMAKVGKELSLMLADLSDAAVYLAAVRQRQGD